MHRLWPGLLASRGLGLRASPRDGRRGTEKDAAIWGTMRELPRDDEKTSTPFSNAPANEITSGRLDHFSPASFLGLLQRMSSPDDVLKSRGFAGNHSRCNRFWRMMRLKLGSAGNSPAFWLFARLLQSHFAANLTKQHLFRTRVSWKTGQWKGRARNEADVCHIRVEPFRQFWSCLISYDYGIS